MKHLIKLAFLLLALLLPATVTAHDFMVNGIYYNILNNNEVAVTYRGTNAWNHNTYSDLVTIPSSVTYNGKTYFVTTIGNCAFYGCSSLTSVTIPNTVTTIGICAFYGCSSLTSVTIPNTVTSISDRTFEYCSSLTSVIIPNSVTSIGPNAFSGCSGLTSITIPNSVTTIDGTAFSNCSELNEVYSYINDVSSISMGSNVFYRDPKNYGDRTLYVPEGTLSDYQEDTNWSWYFGSIVEMGNVLVSSIELNENSAEIIVGETMQLNATILPTNAANKSVNWVSSDPVVVTVSGNGLVTAKALGVASITAMTADGSNLSASCTMTVKQNVVLATSIEMNENSAEIIEGGTLQLTATVFPTNATNKTVNWASSAPTVATVDGNGLVTAVAPGVATITATTTDGSNLSASCVVTVIEDLSNYDNYLSMSDTVAFHGDTIVIPVKMFNEADVISFQTDIFLPEGLELLQEDGEYIIDPSERMTRTHSIMSDNVSNGSIRVLCYSSNYKPFTGNSGDDLFYLTLKVADDAEGDYTIQLKNTLLTNTDFVDMPAPDVAATVNVKAYILGDANNSRLVTVGDVVATAQYVLEQNPQPFVFEAADVNFDGIITVADVSRIAWMVLNPGATAPRRAPALQNSGDRMSGEGISLQPGETRRVSLALDNAMDYIAFQLDLSLPEGLTASDFQLTDRAGSHAFDVNTLGGGNIRALCYSPALTAISGHEGALLTFDVTANAAVTGAIMVDGIELVTTACESVRLDGFAIDVNSTSGVNEQVAGKTVARVDYFNLAGQQIDRPKAGVTLVVTTYTDGTRTTAKVIK